MAAMAPGVSAALITTVAGLLVAIPSMFAYNWLVHNLRVLPSSWTTSRRTWSRRWRRSTWRTNRTVRRHAPLFTTQCPGDAERDQHHAAAGPGVRAADHLRHHHAVAGAGPEPEAPDRRQAGPAHRAAETSAPSKSVRRGFSCSTASGFRSIKSRPRWSGTFSANQNLVVYLRADENSRWKDVEAVIDRCQRHGITRLSPRTEPPKR